MAQVTPEKKRPNWDQLYRIADVNFSILIELLIWIAAVGLGMLLERDMQRPGLGGGLTTQSVVIIIGWFIIARLVGWLLQGGVNWAICLIEAVVSPDDDGEEVIPDGEKEVPQENRQPLDAQDAP